MDNILQLTDNEEYQYQDNDNNNFINLHNNNNLINLNNRNKNKNLNKTTNHISEFYKRRFCAVIKGFEHNNFSKASEDFELGYGSVKYFKKRVLENKVKGLPGGKRDKVIKFDDFEMKILKSIILELLSENSLLNRVELAKEINSLNIFHHKVYRN
ncbi:hypothetical protein ACTFIY_011949 [Dictyostelium cf. discoideum]